MKPCPHPTLPEVHQEFTPHQQAMQYFDRLRDVREEAIHFNSAQKKVSFHDAIPRYKQEEAFLNYGRGQGCGTLSEEDRTTTVSVGSAPEATTGQFADAHQEISETALAAVTMPPFEDMPPLEDGGPPEGAITPDPGTYEPAGNMFTRLHSPITEEDDSDDPHASSQGTPDCSQQGSKKQIEEDNPPTPDIHPGTLDLIVAQLDQEQHESDEAPAKQDAPSTADPTKVELTDAMVDPLQVLLAAVPVVLGSTTVTKEEDQLLGVGYVTTTDVAARLPPDQVKEPSGDATPNDLQINPCIFIIDLCR